MFRNSAISYEGSVSFEFDAEKYRNASQHQQEWGQRLIAELGLRGRERIADLGCGDGRLTAQLARCVPDGFVLGIDASERMIAVACQHAQPNLRFERRDINDVDWQDQFDVIFSNATLHWVKDHRRLLTNVHRALRGGGVARFNFAGDGNCACFNAVVREVMAFARFAAYFAHFDWPWYMPGLDEYAALARQSAFREVHTWGENADRHFPTVEAMVGWIDQPSLVPFLAHVNAVDQSAFRDEVIQRMIARTRQGDGRCFETFRRINLLARK